MFGRSWGRLEAELARTLHETFGLVADRLPWDSAEDTAAFRHMPEARHCPALAHICHALCSACDFMAGAKQYRQSGFVFWTE